MASLFKKVSQGLTLGEFVARSFLAAKTQFLLLIVISVWQSLAPNTVWALASIAVLLWAGYVLVSKAKFRTVGALIAGALLNGIAQAIGFVAGAAAGSGVVAQEIVLSLAAAVVLGAVFAGAGAVVARVQSQHWLRK